MEGYSSKTLRDCRDIEKVIELINSGTILEGIEGVEFTPEELAAEYSYEAAKENVGEELIENDKLEFHLSILLEKGANFSYPDALDVALQYIK